MLCTGCSQGKSSHSLLYPTACLVVTAGVPLALEVGKPVALVEDKRIFFELDIDRSRSSRRANCDVHVVRSRVIRVAWHSATLPRYHAVGKALGYRHVTHWEDDWSRWHFTDFLSMAKQEKHRMYNNSKQPQPTHYDGTHIDMYIHCTSLSWSRQHFSTINTWSKQWTCMTTMRTLPIIWFLSVG